MHSESVLTMEEEYVDENVLEFWDIKFDYFKYPHARGELYEKPTPKTVKARIHFPRMEPQPDFVHVGKRTKLTALCANRQWMRDIPAEIKSIVQEADGGVTLELLLYRKTNTD